MVDFHFPLAKTIRTIQYLFMSTPQHKTPQPTKTICVIFHWVREKNKTKYVNSSRLANTLTSFIISTSMCLWLPGDGHYPQCCLKRPWRWPQTDFMNLSNVSNVSLHPLGRLAERVLLSPLLMVPAESLLSRMLVKQIVPTLAPHNGRCVLPW